MITETILNILLFVPKAIVNALPTIELNIETSAITHILAYIRPFNDLVPLTDALTIMCLILAFNAFKVAYALAIRIKTFVSL